MKEIGKHLKEKREENGVSIEEVAEDLNIDEDAIENMEEGNIRAFKDMYTLKELVKDYSKYLGMDVNDIVEEFNDFLFEHTSKISLEDLEEVKNKVQENNIKKIVSPYTQIPKPKKDYKQILKPLLFFCGIILVLVILIMILKKDDSRNIELKTMKECISYELTY